MAKKYRRENGHGTIVKLNRDDIRNKYQAKVTIGTIDGKQKRKVLGYFATEKEAYRALENWRLAEDSEATKFNEMTLEQIWKLYYEHRSKEGLSDKRMRAMEFNWKRIPDEIKAKKISVITYKMWEDIFDKMIEDGKALETIRTTKTEVGLIYDYAIKNGATIPNHPKLYTLKSREDDKVLVLSRDQIDQLWFVYLWRKGSKEAIFAAETMLMLMYSGCRIEEFLSLKTKDVHLGDGWFEIVNAKTKAGERRIPIHPAVKDIWQDYCRPGKTYVVELNGKKVGYANYRDSYFDQLRDGFGWSSEYTPHALRKTWASYLAYYGVDETVQKIIIGHKGKLSLTERVYTVVPTSKVIAEAMKVPTKFQDLINLVDELSDVKIVTE